MRIKLLPILFFLSVNVGWTQSDCSLIYENLSVYIPDNQPGCVDGPIAIEDATAEVIENESQLPVVYINMEHSFMGDLTIKLTCPNGQVVAMHNQGGGGSFIGMPVDNDSQPMLQGLGFDYWWDANSTNGTWAANAGGTLPSGTYTPFGNMSDFVGCPVNGTWNLEICDLWASDNGFVFAFGLVFPSVLFEDGCPELLQPCSDPDACNYSPESIATTFYCSYPGCNIPGALNFNPAAGCDDGSCIFYEDGCDVSFQLEVASIEPPVLNAWVNYNGLGSFSVLWEFGLNEAESTSFYPSFIYPGDGPYELCLTLWLYNSFGQPMCESIYCESVSADLFQGLPPQHSGIRSSGFTINVLPGIVNILEIAAPDIRIYPNPMQEMTTLILAPGIWNVVLTDASGRAVRSYHNAQNQLQIPRGELNPGLYTLSLSSQENLSRMVKLVVD